MKFLFTYMRNKEELCTTHIGLMKVVDKSRGGLKHEDFLQTRLVWFILQRLPTCHPNRYSC